MIKKISVFSGLVFLSILYVMPGYTQTDERPAKVRCFDKGELIFSADEGDISAFHVNDLGLALASVDVIESQGVTIYHFQPGAITCVVLNK